MRNLKKKIRFLLWVSVEFFKKNIIWFITSFAIFFLGIIFILIFKPFITRLILGNTEKIGIVGNYSYKNPPSQILNLISKPIITIDDKGNIIPVLIEQWEVDNSGKLFRFYFKKNIIWNDGKAFSVKDISSDLLSEGEIKAIDNYTLEIHLQKPTLVLPYYLKKYIYRYPLVGIGGEYKITKIKLKENNFEEIVLSSKLKPKVIIFRFYNTEEQLLYAYKLGKIDKFETSEAQIINKIKNWRNTKIKKEVNYKYMAVLFFNLKNKDLADKNLRNAISYIIPWDDLQQKGEISKSPIPPISSFYDPTLPANTYDEEKGIKLIKESIKGKKPKLSIKSDLRLSELAEHISDTLNKIGIKTHVKVIFSEEELEENFDIAILFWKVPLDIDQYFFWHSTQVDAGNKTYYKNLRIDKYLEEIRSTFSYEKQLISFKKFQKEIVSDKPAIFLYFPYKYTVERKRLFWDNN